MKGGAPGSEPTTPPSEKALPTSGPITTTSLKAYVPSTLRGMDRTEHEMVIADPTLVVVGYKRGEKSVSLNLSKLASPEV